MRDGRRGRIHTIARQDGLPLLPLRWQARSAHPSRFF